MTKNDNGFYFSPTVEGFERARIWGQSHPASDSSFNNVWEWANANANSKDSWEVLMMINSQADIFVKNL